MNRLQNLLSIPTCAASFREQHRAYTEEQERITARHEAESATRLDARRSADQKRCEEEERRNTARDAMVADQRKKERERVAKNREALEVGRCMLKLVQPMLKVPGSSSSTINTMLLLSSIAFYFSLHRLTMSSGTSSTAL